MSDTKTVKRADAQSFLGNLITTIFQLAVIGLFVIGAGIAGRLVYEGVLFGWNVFF